MKITVIYGSPRKYGNSAQLVKKFVEGAEEKGGEIKEIHIYKKNIMPCRGCLKCNVYKVCSINNDDWPEISNTILWADIVVFGIPVYFHSLPGPVKVLIDRFRSFVEVKITEESIEHRPWIDWRKSFVLLLSLGSSSPVDADPVIELFQFFVSILGPSNVFRKIVAPRLQLAGQIKADKKRLASLYPKLGLPEELAEKDHKRNYEFLEQAYILGRQLAGEKPNFPDG